MMKYRLTWAAGAFALAAASGAFAQPGNMEQPSAPPQAAPTDAAPQGRDAQGQMATPAPAMNDQSQAPSAAAAGANSSAVAPTDGGVEAIHQGDNTLVTNGPVPDTPANRAKYGGPMSRTGKHTKPAGN